MKQRSWLVVFLISLVPFAWLVARFNFLCDDAFISFRYARHLATGLGLRFNAGVQPPVEGYTNLLWVLLCAGFEGLGLNPGFFARLTSITLAIACLGFMIRLVSVQSKAVSSRWQWAAPLFAGLLVGLHPAFATWATSGLETMAFSACLFLGFERLMYQPLKPRTLQAAICLACAVLLRADGIVASTSVLLGLYFFARLESRPELVASLRRVLTAILVVVAAQTCFRYFYHGDWLPNTAHAKVNLGSTIAWQRGAIYVAHFLLLFPAIAAAPLLACFNPAGSRAVRHLAVASLIPFCAIYLWYLAVGGDYMAFGRFLVPAIPFAALLFGYGALETRKRPLSKSRLLILSALLMTQWLPALGWSLAPESVLAVLNFRLHKGYETQVQAWQGLVKGVERGRLKGRLLKEITEPTDSLVAGAVGAEAYYSDLFIYDRLGLVTREVALREAKPSARAAGHDKGVPAEFFLKDLPTIMYLDLTRGKTRTQSALPAELRELYVPVEFPAGGGRRLRLVVLRDSHLAAPR